MKDYAINLMLVLSGVILLAGCQNVGENSSESVMDLHTRQITMFENQAESLRQVLSKHNVGDVSFARTKVSRSGNTVSMLAPVVVSRDNSSEEIVAHGDIFAVMWVTGGKGVKRRPGPPLAYGIYALKFSKSAEDREIFQFLSNEGEISYTIPVTKYMRVDVDSPDPQDLPPQLIAVYDVYRNLLFHVPDDL